MVLYNNKLDIKVIATVSHDFGQGCYVRYFSAKSALRAFNLWSALECALFVVFP